MDSKIIGTRINSALASRNKKQKELASELGVPDNTISYFCSGKRVPNTQQIAQIARFLDTTPDYLLGFTQALSSDAKARAAEEYTGLSAVAAKRLRLDLVELKMLGGDGEIPNWFFSSNYFMRLMTATEKYRICTEKIDTRVSLEQYLTLDSNQQNPDLKDRQAAKLEMMGVIIKMANEIDKECDAKGGKG